ncbi:unnamed protein product [Psylliodes chrysocephalus]|uniref:Regulatory protein zeste n=1 Tax=Psylliodes chrysocephalus TaxID=3402493 RepID=A0A9P0GHJ4_9CUCU|nr:unnamed protein product [Psylliodes chrysocephala]
MGNKTKLKTETKRAPNYSVKEKSLLLNILYDSKNIIENKKTDSTTWREKDEAWQNITNIFNSQTVDCPRSKDSLRKYYNIKKSVRKEVLKEKLQIKQTGGRVAEKTEEDCTKDLVLGLINEKTVFGLNTSFGGDTNEIPSNIDAKVTMPDQVETTEGATSAACGNPKKGCYGIADEKPSRSLSFTKKDDWGNFSASKPKNPVTPYLKQKWTKRRRPGIVQPASKLEEKYDHIANIKQELYHLEKEHILKREKREEHIFNLKKTKLELDIKLRELELKKHLDGI